ncbi:N-acylglucosamine 2-epimerase-like [Carassius auratus]|uniref:N-acylglucosamine 2-epimerase-like n=1 Tax=Carassius auratus TaxID=7957 RepID=A0A6P6MTM6_CARAU|nr:N-acylglucosamine 2-epimerase-like [Carassius auratus]
MKIPFHTGWYKQHGGLFYFLDVDSHCPTQLRVEYEVVVASLKLVRPNFLMAYSHRGEPQLLDRFKLIYDHTFSHDFIWSNHRFFHVPRCLYMCEKLLDGLLERQDS